MSQLPDLEGLASFTHTETLYDTLVKKSVEEGYMTEDELLVGRYVTEFLNLNVPKQGDFWTTLKMRDEKLPEACQATAEQFGIPYERAKKLYELSLDIRARNL